MTDPYPPADQLDAFYANTFKWVGRVRDFQVPTPDGSWEFDWNWKATYNHALYTARPSPGGWWWTAWSRWTRRPIRSSSTSSTTSIARRSTAMPRPSAWRSA